MADNLIGARPLMASKTEFKINSKLNWKPSELQQLSIQVKDTMDIVGRSTIE